MFRGIASKGFAAVVVAALASAMAVPGGASATLVDDVDGVLDQVGGTVENLIGGGGSGGASGGRPAPEPEPAGGTPPAYTPPAHGSAPHGAGTIGTVDLAPDDTEPLPYAPGGGSEEAVVGGAYGSQGADGSYHGHITIVSLLGNEIIGVDTAEGETEAGPLDALQTGLLDALCDGSGEQLCLEVLRADSATTGDGSSNSFAVATAEVGGAGGISAGVAESNGNIGDDGTCQTASGDSSVADASVGGALTADVIESGSSSTACNDGSSSQESSSQVINLGGTQVPVPPGCESGAPDTSFDIALVATVCNADDSSSTGGTQLAGPFGIREGLTVFALPLLGDVAKVTTGASESHAVAPPAAPTGGDGPGDDPGGGDGPGGGPGGGGPGDGGSGGGGNEGGSDPDGDGVLGQNDACPSVAGSPAARGCPGREQQGALDRDGDGVVDRDDVCPNVPGPASNGGCPLAGGPTGEGPDRLAFTGAEISALALLGLGVTGSGLALMGLADRRRRPGRS